MSTGRKYSVCQVHSAVNEDQDGPAVQPESVAMEYVKLHSFTCSLASKENMKMIFTQGCLVCVKKLEN